MHLHKFKVTIQNPIHRINHVKHLSYHSMDTAMRQAKL